MAPAPDLVELTAWVDDHVPTRTGPLEAVRERTWSSVWRVPTGDAPLWLKTAPPTTAFEMRLYPTLARAAPRFVLTPVAVGPDRVLLPDAGPPFADTVPAARLGEAMARALAGYGALQRAVADATDPAGLVDLGLVDMGPDILPARFDEAVAFVGAYEGPDAAATFARIRPAFVDACAELADHGRLPGLDHNDLHAANVVGTPDRPRFYDWGDAVLAHPFACLLTPLDTLPESAGTAVRAAYLTGFGDPDELAHELDLALSLAPLARSLVWVRALGDEPARHEHAHAPFAHLLRLAHSWDTNRAP